MAGGEGGGSRSRVGVSKNLPRQFFAKKTNGIKNAKKFWEFSCPEMSPRGGSRPGAGRPPVRLTTLVLERRFRWQNRRHRAALFRDELDLPDDHPSAELLEQLRVAYQRQPWGGAASSLAQTFERVVRGC
jgi:hypothetical protein